MILERPVDDVGAGASLLARNRGDDPVGLFLPAEFLELGRMLEPGDAGLALGELEPGLRAGGLERGEREVVELGGGFPARRDRSRLLARGARRGRSRPLFAGVLLRNSNRPNPCGGARARLLCRHDVFDH
jgi:hypothetical protein